MSSHDLVRDAAEGRHPNSSGWIRVNCPCCVNRGRSRDDERSLGVHHETGVFRCFRCGVFGCLSGRQGLDDSWDYQPPAEITELPPEFTPIFGDCSPNPGLAYLLQKRLFTPRQVLLGMAHYAASGSWYGRVIFPHYHRDRLWGWTGRSCSDEHELRVRYPAGMSRDLLYNQEVLDSPSSTPCLVVESVTSSLRFLPNAVACLGQPTNVQVDTLASSPHRPLIILLDGDHWLDARRLARELRHSFRNAKAILLPPGEDPDSVGLRDPLAIPRAVQHLQETTDVEVDLSPVLIVETWELE